MRSRVRRSRRRPSTGWRGANTVAAHSVAQQLWTYVQMPAMALGAAVSAMAAQNIGAGRWDRVAEITRMGIVYSVALTGALVALVFVLARPILSLFLGDDSTALPIAGAHLGPVDLGVRRVRRGARAVRHDPRQRRGGRPAPRARRRALPRADRGRVFRLGSARFGADALWLSYPIGMVAAMAMAALLHRYGGWCDGTLLPPVASECVQRALHHREPLGTVQPVV